MDLLVSGKGNIISVFAREDRLDELDRCIDEIDL